MAGDNERSRRHTHRVGTTKMRATGVHQDAERARAGTRLLAHWRLTATFIVVVVIIGGGAVGDRWRNDLHLFGPAGYGRTSGPIAIGETYYADASFWISDHGTTVHLRSVAPHVT